MQSLVEYESGKNISPVIKSALMEWCKLDVRCAVINILRWQKSQARLRHLYPQKSDFRPLSLNGNLPWHAAAAYLVTTDSELNLLFNIRNKCIEFRDEVPAQQRLEVECYVDQNFNPILMT